MRLEMTKASFSRLTNEHPARAMTHRVAGAVGVAVLLLMTGIAAAQGTTPTTPAAVLQTPPPAIQRGFAVHQTVDLGGHIVGVSGSGAMYDTLVNIQSGPRVLGQTLTMHAVPGSKHTLLNSLTAFSNGFGGDPINVVNLDASKGKLYEFSGLFRRNRQYFDYDLLNNPSIPLGLSIPIGPRGSLGSFPIPQVQQSPVMFNTVRRMLDTGLTIFPLSKVTFRVGYSQNIFQGPSMSPSRSVGKTQFMTEEYQRNSTDDFTGAVDWKPLQQTKFTFEEEVAHIKENSYFVLAPNSLTVQEADGLPVSLGNWDQYTAYSSSNCTASIKTPGVVLVNPSGSVGLPVVDPACSVYSSYLRSQPTRILYPTETFRFQSSSLKNIAMNGDFNYTKANSNLPNYYENFQGLVAESATAAGVTPAYPAQAARTATFTGHATAQRRVVAADFGITWQATKTLSFSDQVDFSNAHQPGMADISAGITANTPTNPNATINYPGPLGPGVNLSTTGTTTGPGGVGIPAYGYFGQELVTNNATASWDATPRATFALTYRYFTHTIVQGAGSGPNAEIITINANGGTFNAALHPTSHWDINGTVEVLYADNAFTTLTPRQTQHYRIHTLYKPTHWATFSGAFNDLERHNNTNNTGKPSANGPLDHVDHSRFVSVGAVLSPSEHYGLDVNYAYTDVYTATNICFLSGATAAMPGVNTGVLCPDTPTSWYARDFMDAPTQSASVGLALSPVRSIHAQVGYRISAVSGNQFFTDALQVNGSLQSAYQTPYVHVAWTVHPGWVWSANYDYYGYGEGGPSGAKYCSYTTSAAAAANPFPCALNPPSGPSAPRNFHANLVTLSMHYEF
jgi:hypothetical protein